MTDFSEARRHYWTGWRPQTFSWIIGLCCSSSQEAPRSCLLAQIGERKNAWGEQVQLVGAFPWNDELEGPSTMTTAMMNTMRGLAGLEKRGGGEQVVCCSKNRPAAAFSCTTSFSLLGTCQLVSVKGPVHSVYCSYWYGLAAAKAFENLAETWLLRNSTLRHAVFTPSLSSSPVAWTRTGRMLFIIFSVVLFVFHHKSGTLDKIDIWWQTHAWLENFWWLFSAWKGSAVLYCHSTATARRNTMQQEVLGSRSQYEAQRRWSHMNNINIKSSHY